MNAHFQFNGHVMSQEVCEKHGLKKILTGKNLTCPECAREFVLAEKTKHQAETDRAVFEKHIASAMLPDRHLHSAFSNYQTHTQGQAHALSQCASYAQRITAKRISNFIMVGSTGTGKTHLACATAKHLLKKGLKARYITSEEIAQRIMNAWDKDTKDQSEEAVIYQFAQYDLLIVDEYGLHDRDKRMELVHKVLTKRYDSKKPTMLISNFTLKKLHDDLGDRLWSRFQHDGLTVVECNWSDARMGDGCERSE